MSWPDEFSYRVLKNRLTEQWAQRETDAAAALGSLAADYAKARAKRDLDIYAVGAGECVGLIRDRSGTASIVERMVSEAQALLTRAAELTKT